MQELNIGRGYVPSLHIHTLFPVFAFALIAVVVVNFLGVGIITGNFLFGLWLDSLLCAASFGLLLHSVAFTFVFVKKSQDGVMQARKMEVSHV